MSPCDLFPSPPEAPATAGLVFLAVLCVFLYSRCIALQDSDEYIGTCRLDKMFDESGVNSTNT